MQQVQGEQRESRTCSPDEYQDQNHTPLQELLDLSDTIDQNGLQPLKESTSGPDHHVVYYSERKQPCYVEPNVQTASA